MKHILLSIFTLSSFLVSAQTQIPNSGFETWTFEPFMDTGYDEPKPYNSGNLCGGSNGTGNCEVAAVQSTSANSGDYAVSVTNGGIAGLNLLDYDFTDEPTAVEFYANVNLSAGEEAEFLVYLHNGSIFSDPTYTAGDTLTMTESTSGYQKFTAPITYISADAHVYISMILSVTGDNSSVLIDDLALVYDPLSTSKSVDSERKVSFSPNPSNSQVTFSETIERVEVRTLSGTMVKEALDVNTMNVDELNAGMYLLHIQDGNYHQTDRLVVE